VKQGSPWKRIRQQDLKEVESFLHRHEAAYLSACAQFLLILQNGTFQAQVWVLRDEAGEVSGVLIYRKHCLYPVFPGRGPLPGFPSRFLLKISIYAVQGLPEEVTSLREALVSRGCPLKGEEDYCLMSLGNEPSEEALRSGPGALILRPPFKQDTEELVEIQRAYDQEEVLPPGVAFDPEHSRRHLEYLLATEQVLVALLEGRIVGKIYTNARSFTRCQIGGVYVVPRCRRQGIGVRICALFVQKLAPQYRGIGLCVRKRNLAAFRVYRRVGFIPSGDYRICYF
jgi:ribosomal protein S18 acetylase RimI-like enzyme